MGPSTQSKPLIRKMKDAVEKEREKEEDNTIELSVFVYQIISPEKKCIEIQRGGRGVVLPRRAK